MAAIYICLLGTPKNTSAKKLALIDINHKTLPELIQYQVSLLKKLLKKLLIPVLTSRPVTNIAHRLLNCGVPVFMIHRVSLNDQTGSVSSDHLRKCLKYLVEHNYTFISLEQLILSLLNHKPVPNNAIVFTMDDGFIDQAEIAAPIFLEYDCPITIFVITGMLDKKTWPWDDQVAWIIDSSKSSSLATCNTVKSMGLRFDGCTNNRILRQSVQNAMKLMDANAIPNLLKQLADDAGVTMPNSPPEAYQPMTWDMARQLETQGVQFAPHTVNHYIMSRLHQETMKKEIDDCWSTLNKELRCPVKIFCYPTGRKMDYGAREIKFLKKNSYLGAMSTTPGVVRSDNCSENQLYYLPRLNMPDNMTEFIHDCSWLGSVR